MKKEVVLAIVIGFGLGLIITYGIWLANNSLKNLPTKDEATVAATTSSQAKDPNPEPTKSSPSSTPTSKNPNQFSVTINEPQDEWPADKDKINVTGSTAAKSVVTITSEGAQQIVVADDNGKFSAEISLDGGYNIITATAFDSKGNSATQSITVTYTTAKI